MIVTFLGRNSQNGPIPPSGVQRYFTYVILQFCFKMILVHVLNLTQLLYFISEYIKIYKWNIQRPDRICRLHNRTILAGELWLTLLCTAIQTYELREQFYGKPTISDFVFGNTHFVRSAIMFWYKLQVNICCMKYLLNYTRCNLWRRLHWNMWKLLIRT